MTDVIVTGPADLRPILYFVIMFPDVIEPCGCQGGHKGPDVVGLLPEFKFW